MHKAVVSTLLLLLAACGDDDKGSPTASALCRSQCAKADECGLLDGTDVSVDECTSACAKAQSSINQSSCKFTDEEIQDCKAALDDQTCEQVEESDVPEECAKTCT